MQRHKKSVNQNDKEAVSKVTDINFNVPNSRTNFSSNQEQNSQNNGKLKGSMKDGKKRETS